MTIREAARAHMARRLVDPMVAEMTRRGVEEAATSLGDRRLGPHRHQSGTGTRVGSIS